MANILTIDIETMAGKGYIWKLWDENISMAQLIEPPGRMICFGAQWLGERKVQFFSEWDDGHDGMIDAVHDLLSQADAVVTFNGDKFDLPKINGEFLMRNLSPAPPIPSIDLYKTVKKMGLPTARLAYVGPLLKVGEKMKNEGFPLWRAVDEGDPKAMKRMEKYCVQDVRMTTELYKYIRPYIRNHPHVANIGEDKQGGCPTCGSDNLQKRGFRRTRLYRIQRLQCQDCGSWTHGAQERIK